MLPFLHSLSVMLSLALPRLHSLCRPLSDEELDAMLPGASEGYKVLSEPPG